MNNAKPMGAIVREHVCTVFNLLNLLIVLALAAVGAWSNMAFFLIIVLNAAIGIAQEIAARKKVEQLSLLTAPRAKVSRDGVVVEILPKELHLGDRLVLESGMQICADAVLESGSLEVNEALLTGESDLIAKKPGDELLSGSVVIAGSGQAKVLTVGEACFAMQIQREAGTYKKTRSQLMESMGKVTRFTALVIPFVAALLLGQAILVRGEGLSQSVVSTAAGLLGLLPKGLVLLISVSLATGAAVLAKKRVLVQDLFALEVLPRVDVLCLDKTGTITKGEMEVEELYAFSGQEETLSQQLAAFARETQDNNATAIALKKWSKTQKQEAIPASGQLGFSSQRGYSCVEFDRSCVVIVGAPERVLAEFDPKRADVDEIARLVKKRANAGKRVLFVGVQENDAFTLLGMVCLADPVRESAKKAIAYLKNEGVALKVISGDNPQTVAAIARKVGISGRWVDMSEVSGEKEVAHAAQCYEIFGRVSPLQKRQLIQAFRAQGHTVAMTGDGVNDLMAMRESDLGIAMSGGADAARQVAKVVLLDSDFGVLVDVMNQGRRVINNVTRTAGVFFVKTIYSFLLCVICILQNIPFPFLPIQITLIDAAIEAWPAFATSFSPDNRKPSGQFLPEVLRRALPNALAIVVSFLLLRLVSPAFDLTADQEQMLDYLIVAGVGMEAVVKSCLPFDRFRMAVCALMGVGYVGAVIIFHKILFLPAMNAFTMGLWMLCLAAAIAIERGFAWMIDWGGRVLLRVREERKGDLLCP